jgi:uncharacterized repeat protein (TIGR01451 family)
VRMFSTLLWSSLWSGAALGATPLAFAPNVGQLLDPDARYVARDGGSVALVTDDGAAFPVGDRIVRMRFDGGSAEHWRTEERGAPVTFAHGTDDPVTVPSYGRVEAAEMWRGVDVVWHGGQGELEYDLVARPGADLAVVGQWFEGADEVSVDADGDLVVVAGGATLRQRQPVAWQEDLTPVSVDWSVDHLGRATFALGAHDPTQTVTIDPVIVYEVQFTGDASNEQGNEESLDIAIDSKLDAYVTGYTTSTDFPTTGGAPHQGLYDAFVLKLDPDGNLVWSMFLGGTGDEHGRGIAVDGKGSAIVMGRTTSTDFPTRNAFQATLSGESDAFVTRITPDGRKFVYSTYLGGSSWEIDQDFEVLARLFTGDVDADAVGNAYVTGDTTSLDFPTTPGAFQPASAGGPCIPACEDVFAVKLDGTGQLVWSTYLGGKDNDRGHGISVDPNTQQAVVYGEAGAGYPTTPGSFQPNAKVFDFFVTKLATDGASLAWSTFLGGTGSEFGANELAIGRDSSVYVTGMTSSFDFPTTPGVLQTTKAGDLDVVVAHFDAAGALLWSTYVGGLDDEGGFGIDVDKKGRTVFTGFTTSGGTYPEVDEFATCTAADMLTMTELNPAGSKVTFSSCIPTSGFVGNTLAIRGNTQVVGGSTEAGPGAVDATVLRVDDRLPGSADLAVSQTDSPDPVLHEFDDITYTITIENLGTESALDVRLDDRFPDAVTLRTVTTSQGTCSDTSINVFCELGEIPAGGVVIVQFDVTVACTTPQPMFNTAEVSSATVDPNDTNDVSEETTALDPGAC